MVNCALDSTLVVIITPHACTRRKAYGSACPFICLSAQISPDLETQASEPLVSTTNQWKSSKNWLHYALNHLARPTSIANTVFILSTLPTACHVLCAHTCAQPSTICKTSKGRQLQPQSISHTTDSTVQMEDMGTCSKGLRASIMGLKSDDTVTAYHLQYDATLIG